MVSIGTKDDIESWMELVESVSPSFPGLETDKAIAEHRATVLGFIEHERALCVKDGDRVVGVLLFSVKHNMICCLAVLREYRGRGIASELLATALGKLDNSRAVTVSTFREDDEKGKAPRALYKKFGFILGELTVEFGYPNQVFVLNV